MHPKDVHVDIGCGIERYLLKKTPCSKKYGFDQQLGHFIDKKIPLKTNSVDYVTMLASIEHFDNPLQIIKECYRILKNDGNLIITTPKAKGYWIMKLYAPNFKEEVGEHKQHFDYEQMNRLLKGLFLCKVYKTFMFGFNQLFICRKVEADNMKSREVSIRK